MNKYRKFSQIKQVHVNDKRLLMAYENIITRKCVLIPPMHQCVKIYGNDFFFLITKYQ